MEKKIFSAYFIKSQLVPLYGVLILILGLSVLLTYLYPSNTFMMYLMGIWFGTFGIMKLYNLEDFVKNFSEYDLVSKKYSIYGYAHPFIEIILGFIYIFDTQMMYTMTANIMGIIISGLGIASAYGIVSSGKNISCACMGTYWKLPMTKVTILENTVMLGMILLMILFPSLMMNM